MQEGFLVSASFVAGLNGNSPFFGYFGCMNDNICPASRQEWRDWLEKNHHTSKSIWLIYYKQHSKVPSITYSDAVDEALCFGWIDSVKKTLDEDRYIQYFSPRKPGSGWSKINKTKIEKLVKEGLMAEPGFNCIGRAKLNGSWTLLDDVEELAIPVDLEKAFRRHKGAKKYFSGLSRSVRKAMLYWVVTAKMPATRENRINEIASLAGLQQRPKQF